MNEQASPERRAHYERISGKGPKRGLTAQEAAEHCGMSVSGFHTWIKRQGIQCRIPGSLRYDIRALDAAIDRLMGLSAPATEPPEVSPLEAWRAKRNGCAA